MARIVFSLTDAQLAALEAGQGGKTVKWPDHDQRTLTGLLARGLLSRVETRCYVLSDAGESVRALCERLAISAGAKASD